MQKAIYFLVLLWLSACAAGKKPGATAIAEAPKKKPAIKSAIQKWPASWWTAKGKLTIQTNGNSFPVNITLRAEEGKAIWFSASAFGLMEVARGRFDQDSVRIIDKVNNRCIRSSMEGISSILPVALSMKHLQHFLMGRVFWDSLDAAVSRQNGDTLFVNGNEGTVSYEASVLRPYQLLNAAAAPDAGSSMRLQNSDYRDFGGFPVSFRKEIKTQSIQNGKITEGGARIEFNKFEFLPARPELEFTLPPDCEPMQLK